MTISVTRYAPPSDLSMGSEDGGLFSALMWPEELGEIPFKEEIQACVVPDGFLLKGGTGEEVIAFIGFGEEVMADFKAGTVTIMRYTDDDYETREVVHGESYASSEVDYSQAA